MSALILLIKIHMESLAVMSALISIYLVTKANIFNFLFGIISIFLYIIIFYQTKLYADMSLQFCFLFFQFYGIYYWLNGNEKQSALPVSKTPQRVWIHIIIVFPFLFLSIAYLLKYHTDSNTVMADAITTAISLIAQWMVCKKYIENWGLWVIANLIYIKLYLFKSLFLTAGLYGIFLIFSFTGYRYWKLLMLNSVFLNPATDMR